MREQWIKIVSVSNKAFFGLMLIDNYLERWKNLAEEEAAGTGGSMENNNTTVEAETGSGLGEKRKQEECRESTLKSGTMQVRGLSGAGISRFN